jgi:hypothetical protein
VPEIETLCEACGYPCDGQFCLREKCVADRFGIKPPKPKPRRKRVKKLPKPIAPAKFKRRQRVDHQPPIGTREGLNDHHNESYQRITIHRYLERDKIEALIKLGEELEK